MTCGVNSAHWNSVLVQFEAGGKADQSAAAEATRWLSLCLTGHTFSDGRTDSSLTNLLTQLSRKNISPAISVRNYFLTVDRKWWGRWRYSLSKAFRVRAWYSLRAMLRHIAWTSSNRIAKKRQTRNTLFALKMGDFLSSVSAFPSGSFKSREKWSFV